VVGAGTAEADDPRLTAREVECHRQPLRVVVGSATLTPESALVRSLAAGPVLVVAGNDLGDDRRAELRSWGVEVATAGRSGDGLLEPHAVAALLAERGVQTVLLEGGRRLAGSWWAAGVIDKVAAFICPKLAPGTEHRSALLAPGPALMDQAASLREVEVRQVGTDVLMTGYTGDVY